MTTELEMFFASKMPLDEAIRQTYEVMADCDDSGAWEALQASKTAILTLLAERFDTQGLSDRAIQGLANTIDPYSELGYALVDGQPIYPEIPQYHACLRKK